MKKVDLWESVRPRNSISSLVETKGDTVIQESWNRHAQDVMNMLLDRRQIRKIRRVAKDDEQTKNLADEVYDKMVEQLASVIGDSFASALGYMKWASETSDSANARNMIFKAAHAMGLKLPSGMF